MIFKALACDYDGTLASEDRIGAEALAALGQAREAGLRLILVTGRTFFELIRVCERLDLFDAVVAENGGVLYFPRAGAIRDQAPPPPPRLLAELDRRGISFQVGRVIVGTARGDEEEVGKALAAAGVSLELVYNRAALMLLPAGVSKGAGVQQVIRALGLSFHDVLALGDAENDFDLFEACGWTGCPANAVPPLTDRADWVFPGEDGTAIARAIVGPILKGLLPAARFRRHQIEVGWAAGTSEPVTIPARGINVLIHGDPLSGKSWLAGALVEHLLGRHYAVCVIDPEGDYRVLGRLPGVTWAEIRENASVAGALGQFERDPSACVVVDLSTLPHAKKVQIIETMLALIRRLRRRLGLPHWVVLDEAHYSLHREGVADSAIGVEDKGFCLATYKASWLRGSVLKAADVWVLARTTAAEELAFLRSLLAESSVGSEEPLSVLRDLPRGEFLLIQSDGAGVPSPLTFVATPRETPHVRHLTKYADSRVSPGRRFLFRRPDGPVVASADSLNAFRAAVAAVEESVLAYHAERGDFSRWVLDVFADPALGSQLRKTETRWGRGEITDLRAAIGRLIAARYGA
ncbi:MAG: HAD family phosphatase [Candidatus Rokubacteria bacterium]|nr:HAD family phosphatase [Candidatus Rokubacteria bacterium]